MTDVSDAKTRLTSGKVPRNIVTTLGVVAAVAVGTLGYFYQSGMESDQAKEAEAKKAKKLQERTSTPDSGGLDQLIRQQQEEARRLAALQAASATKAEPASKAPVMTAKDFVQPPATPATGELAKANDTDTVMSSPIFKQDGGRMRRDAGKRQPDLAGVVDPAQMRSQQQVAASGMDGLGGVGGVGGIGAGSPGGGDTAPDVERQAVPARGGGHDLHPDRVRRQARAVHGEPGIRDSRYLRWRPQFGQARRVPRNRDQ
ncbi:hypothetical protein [Cupriavidus basilensis]